MLEIQTEALKEHNNGLAKEFQAKDFDDIPPNKHNWLLWFALNLIFKLVQKLISKKDK